MHTASADEFVNMYTPMVSTELDSYALRNKVVSRTGGNCVFLLCFHGEECRKCMFLWENRRGDKEGRERVQVELAWELLSRQSKWEEINAKRWVSHETAD